MQMKTLHELTKWFEANGFESIIEGSPTKLDVVKCISHDEFESKVWKKISSKEFEGQTVDSAFEVLSGFLAECGLDSQAFTVLQMKNMMLKDTLTELVKDQIQTELSAK